MAAPKDRWHQLADAIDASNLAASDKAVLRRLLDRADYGTAELPEKFAPKQADIARKASITPRQVRRSLRHAERHGWVTVGGATGRGHRLTYRLDIGGQCGCSGRVHEQKADTEHRKGGHGVPLKADTKGGHAAGQGTVPTERQREGRVGRKPEPQLAPCSVCKTPMDPVLSANGYRTHPCCDPDEISPHWPPGTIGAAINANIL